MPDTLIKLGQKAVISDEGLAEGWLAPFGGPMKGNRDLDGEAFTPKTDFALDYYPSIPILYGHGQDAEVGAAKVGEITLKEIRDKGLWVQGQLDKQSKYYDALRELAEKGDLYWSSGAIAHLVDKDTKGFIKQWPIAEATLTLTPSNPQATASVKAAETETSVSPAAFTVTFSYPVKEGRRHSAADIARLQQIHQLISELGSPEPEPPPDETGKEPEPEPAKNVATKAADVVAPVSETDLAAVKAMLRDIAAEAPERARKRLNLN